MRWSRKQLKKWWAAIVVVVVAGGLVIGWQATGSTGVNIRIEGSGETLFVGRVDVDSCVITDTGGVQHAKEGVAACGLAVAAEQTGFSLEYIDYGWALFLNGIGDDTTPADFSSSWSFWVNDVPASVSVDSYMVQEGDDILLAFAGYPTVPLRVRAPSEVGVGESFTVSVDKLVGGWDLSFVWQGGWEKADEALVHIGDEIHMVVAGEVTASIDRAGETMIWAEGSGLVRSDKIFLEVKQLEASPSAEPSMSPSVTPLPSLTPSSIPSPTVSPTPVLPSPSMTVAPSPTPMVGIRVNNDEISRAARDGMGYLRSQQDVNGSIDGQMVSAWSAMAFGSAEIRAADVYREDGRSLLQALEDATLMSATDVARQILALRAAGENVTNFNDSDLVESLRAYWQGGQIGAHELINDDIFGVLALLAAGVSVEDGIVKQSAGYVVSKQEENGSWDGLDMTAAAVQALKAYKVAGGSVDVGEALTKARAYLWRNQDSSGGFGSNSATTAWVIQAIVALGEEPNDWTGNSGKNPWQALIGYQNSNGGFGWKSKDDVSPFMTAYAVTALSRQTWPVKVLAVRQNEVVVVEEREIVNRVAGSVDSGATESVVGPVSEMTIDTEGRVAGSVNSDLQGRREGGNRAESVVDYVDEQELSEGVEVDRAQDMPIGPGQRDRQFAITWFGLANAGVGFAVSRMFVKLW